jgi:dihydroflavonol-4-reductase
LAFEGIALVTGGTGFVGSAVVRSLIERGHKARALVRPNSTLANLDGLDVELRAGSLTDPASFRAALAGCRSLFHVAADYRLWVRNPAEMYAANVDGTRALMEAALAAGVERIVYTSSVATLGIVPGGVADEATPSTLADMPGHYKRSKFLAEEEVKRLVREAELPAVIVNPSTPIGPRDIKPTPTGRIIVDAANGKIPAFVDTGLNFAHVDDVADGHILALDHGKIGERYILGGDDMTLETFLAEIAGMVGRKPPKIKLPYGGLLPLAYGTEAFARLFGGEPLLTVDGLKMSRKKMFFSPAKAKRELGYKPRPATDAIADAIAWFRQAGYIR